MLKSFFSNISRPTLIDKPQSFIQCRNSIEQNINLKDWNNVSITGIEDLNIGLDFKIDGDGIKCLFDGYIDISAVIRGKSQIQRAANEIRIVKNDTTLNVIASSGYIRAASGHNISSSSITVLTECKKNDVIFVQSKVGGSSGIIKMIKDSSVLIIRKII